MYITFSKLQKVKKLERIKRMALLQLELHQMIVPWLCSLVVLLGVAEAASTVKYGCPEKCGDVGIPYPFGTQEGCYLLRSGFVLEQKSSPWRISCINSKPYISLQGNQSLEVLDISVLNRTVNVRFPIVYANCHNQDDTEVVKLPLDLSTVPFYFSSIWNMFTAVGCNNLAVITQNSSIIAGCMSICSSDSDGPNRRNFTCSGINCCQTTIPYLNFYNVTITELNKDQDSSHQQCKYAYLVNQEWFSGLQNQSSVKEMGHVPVTLGWEIDSAMYWEFRNGSGDLSTYRCDDVGRQDNMGMAVQCTCKPGFQGNPYLLQGCEDIDECLDANVCQRQNSMCVNTYGGYYCYMPWKPRSIFALNVFGPVVAVSLGLLFLPIGCWQLNKAIKIRKKKKLEKEFFKRNGGLLLEEKLSSGEVSVEKIRMFRSKELDKATDRYNITRKLGQGGQGTVYKGMLADGRIVAVKKSKILDQGNAVEKVKLHQFINEIAVLSQINHRNVVKLLGCCLETKVPMLVYEFIPNGTLFQLLHEPAEEFHLTWEMRLRIATEVAGALSYLHSAASMPIYHRDIKSTNILLDEKYRAKVADFGTSRSLNTLDQTHVTTLVQGTFGYLDPEFFRSGQFTDKSDVYSFGVVLVELLTGEKPISSKRSEERISLVTYFLFSMEKGGLDDTLDEQVKKEGAKEDILIVANLARRCLHLTGKDRPTMKEITMELEGIQKSQKAFNLAHGYAGIEYHRDEMMAAMVVSSSSTDSGYDTGSSSSPDTEQDCWPK